MKRLFILSVLFLYAATSMAQTVNDTVIIAWKKKNLTTQQEMLFDTLQLQIYNLNDVRYFKKVTPGYAAWNNYYHIRCATSADTVLDILEKSGLFDTIYYDKKVEVECSNPVATSDPLNSTYINDMLGLPCAWSLTTGNQNYTVGLIDSDFQKNLHSDLWGKVNDYYQTGDFTSGIYYKGPVNPTPGNDNYHGLVMSGIIAAVADNSLGLCGAAYNTKLNLYDYSTAGSGNYHSEVTSALNFAAQNGEKIVNISLRYCAGEDEDFVIFTFGLLI
ncbi:MAG TPA: S8 family serine peptidase, partial [Bacteroidales bacterium]|nr:S8 family serine peptidase [Bacteroidales bacterium]